MGLRFHAPLQQHNAAYWGLSTTASEREKEENLIISVSLSCSAQVERKKRELKSKVGKLCHHRNRKKIANEKWCEQMDTDVHRPGFCGGNFRHKKSFDPTWECRSIRVERLVSLFSLHEFCMAPPWCTLSVQVRSEFVSRPWPNWLQLPKPRHCNPKHVDDFCPCRFLHSGHWDNQIQKMWFDRPRKCFQFSRKSMQISLEHLRHFRFQAIGWRVIYHLWHLWADRQTRSIARKSRNTLTGD